MELLSQATSSMDRVRARFFASQLENLNKPRKGHRYNIDDKILALALHKQSGSGYRLLSNIFDLPSEKTLQRLLQNIEIKPGLSSASFELFKCTAFSNPLDRYCILIFDEMNVTSHLQYNVKQDYVEGFENFGFKTTGRIANYVQVYMLRGIFSKWKQPVYYNAVQGGTKAADIMNIIKLIVAEASAAGLIIVATICDQGTNNVSAIKSLISETRAVNLRKGIECYSNTFSLNGSEIIPLFDVPHLLKGVRNNLLIYNLHFEIDSHKKIAKWQHIYNSYKMDPYIGNVRSMPRLTDYHVNPAAVRKMKVSFCTQVFSNSVARAINLMAFSGVAVNVGDETIQLEKSAMDTAECCQFFDLLFDSLNGSTIHSTKQWKKAVSQKTGHFEFWNSCIKTLQTMYFVNGQGKKMRTPSIENFIFTLKNFKLLFSNLFNVGFKSRIPRTFNQGPLENFFGKIRQKGYRHVKPTISSFTPLYKSVMVNTLTSKHSLRGNCEDDDSSLFFTLKKFVMQNASLNSEVVIVEPFTVSQVIHSTRTTFMKQIMAYVCGFIMRKISLMRTCADCKNSILTETASSRYHHFTTLKSSNINSKLFYVREEILNVLFHAYALVLHLLQNNIHSLNLKKRVIATLCHKYSFEINCTSHKKQVTLLIFSYFTKILLFNYVKQINLVPCGKDLRKLNVQDPQVFKDARILFLKRRK